MCQESVFMEGKPFPTGLKDLLGLETMHTQVGVLTGVSRTEGEERLEREQQERGRMRARRG